MPKFRNKTNQDLAIPGIGIAKAGQVVDCPEGFHNANFERVGAKETKKDDPEPSDSADLSNKNKQNE